MNLVMANLLSCFVLTPLILLDTVSTNIIPCQTLCLAMHGIATIIISGSMLAQLLIGIDQHLAVLNPLHYHRRINENRCWIMCLCAWTLSIFFGIIQSVEIEEDTTFAETTDLFAACKNRTRTFYQVASGLTVISLTFVLPLCLLVVIYCRVFCAARDNSIRTRRNSACSMTMEGVGNANNYSTGNFLGVGSSNVNLSRSPSMKSTGSHFISMTSNLRASMRHKMSHASNLLLYGEEGRAAKVTLLVLFAIVFCWAPFFTVQLFHLLGYYMDYFPDWINTVALFCALSNTVLSPIFYAYRSKRVQRDVRKVLGMSKKFNETDGRQFHREAAAKVKRLKSLSCPQLLVSSVNDNENTSSSVGPATRTAMTSLPLGRGKGASDRSPTSEEQEPMMNGRIQRDLPSISSVSGLVIRPQFSIGPSDVVL